MNNNSFRTWCRSAVILVLVTAGTLAFAQSTPSLRELQQQRSSSDGQLSEEQIRQFRSSFDQPSTTPDRSGQLSDEQIAQFQTEVAGRRDGEKTVFTAGFRPRTLNAQERSRYSRSSRVPFQLIADYQEHRLDPRTNRVLRRRLPGRVNYYILDSDGKIVDRGANAVERMCPS